LEKLNKIVLHWTAGTYIPNSIEKKDYHYMVTGDCDIIRGNFTPEDNIDCKDDRYARHCGGGNTGAIGVAICAMAGYKNSLNVGWYPVKAEQIETFFELAANLCLTHKIPVTPQSVMTHYEFGKAHPMTPSGGKIDINHIPTSLYKNVNNDKVGDLIRSKIKWYMEDLVKGNRKPLVF
jgi:hypothetical protein